MVFSLDRLDIDAAEGPITSVLVCTPIIDDGVTRITLAFILVLERC